MNSIAQSYYRSTVGSDFRDRMRNGGDPFPFDALAYGEIEKESSISGMLIVWCTVLIESVLNTAIAESTNNRSLATFAIEYANDVAKRFKGSQSKSELANKARILSDTLAHGSSDDISGILESLDKLAQERNSVIHDKPYEIIDNGDGDIEVRNYQIRNDTEFERVDYERLQRVFTLCSQIISWVKTISRADGLDLEEIDFASLGDG